MAVFLNNGVVLTINSVDLSDHVTAVTINRSFDELEVTAMGVAGGNANTLYLVLSAKALAMLLRRVVIAGISPPLS